MLPESILSDEGLKVLDAERQELHLQFVKSFYQHVRSHITGTSEHRRIIKGATEPRRLMPTAYLSPQSPPSAIPTSSQQQNNFRPSNCGLVINLSPAWEENLQPIELRVQCSVFLPKLDLSQVEQRSLRAMWQRYDIDAEISCTIQELVATASPALSTLNQEIANQLKAIVTEHSQDHRAWINGLERTIDDLSSNEVTYAHSNLNLLQAELRKRALEKQNKKKRQSDRPQDNDVGQIAAVKFDVKVEVQKRETSGQTRLRLFLRNKSQDVGRY